MSEILRKNLVALSILSLVAVAGCSKSDEAGTQTSAKSHEGGMAGAGVVSPPAPPEVVIKTTLGEITVRLHPQKAPLTVSNFLDYVRKSHYDHTIFHHVESGYIALGGGLTSELVEKPSRYPVINEAGSGLKNLRHTIAMSRSADSTDSHQCQFYINLVDNPSLDANANGDPGYCVFGEVIGGQEVLERLASAPVRSAEGFDKLPVETVMIESVRRTR